MKVKFPQAASHGLYSKEKNSKEKRWVRYSDDNDDIVEIEIEVDLEKEKLYNETITLYDKEGYLLFYVNNKNMVNKLV